MQRYINRELIFTINRMRFLYINRHFSILLWEWLYNLRVGPKDKALNKIYTAEFIKIK